jgi:uncharacterized paraquat-inducible protein A
VIHTPPDPAHNPYPVCKRCGVSVPSVILRQNGEVLCDRCDGYLDERGEHALPATPR